MSDTEGIQESEFQVERMSALGNRMSSGLATATLDIPPLPTTPYTGQPTPAYVDVCPWPPCP